MQLITLGIAAALTLSGAALMTKSPEQVLPPEAKPITLIGCVQTGTTPASFVLASATRAPELTLGAPARPDASSEHTAATPSGRVTRYQLVADGHDLTMFVGHKVEATGAVTTVRSATERPRPVGDQATLFTATAVKEVSTAC
jgi:hypothetical protein